MPGLGSQTYTNDTGSGSVVSGASLRNSNGSFKQGSVTASLPVVNVGSTTASGGTNGSSGGVGNWYGQLAEQRDYNNDWNSAQTAMLNAYNHNEAALQRDWNERMFRNYHQYEVQDLLAAGLNPVLSAGGSPNIASGASASGSKANADDTLSNGLISMMAALISASSASTVANIYTQNQRWMAENYPSNPYQAINALFSNNDGSASGVKNLKKWTENIFKKNK